MVDIQNLILVFFFGIMLVICLFVVVHATLQISNNQVMLGSNKIKDKSSRAKMIKIIIVGIALFSGLAFKIVDSIYAFNASDTVIQSYKETTTELNMALSLEFSTYKGGTYTSAQKIAAFLNKQLPIMKHYYLKNRRGGYYKFSDDEISRYKLQDFVNKPTLVTYDGLLMSMIKFKEGCKYVNKAFIGNSDCLIEIDVNYFDKPNQIGQDRTLFAINGNNNTIISDPNFFKK